MASNDLDGMLLDATGEVLETMFFSAVMGDAIPDEDAAWISARLSFHGQPSGRFGVRVPPDSGRRIAAGFLGLEEDSISDSQVGEVVCEMANMLCGSVLSRLEKDTRFELSHPELDSVEAGVPDGCTAIRVFELDEGTLAVWLDLRQAA